MKNQTAKFACATSSTLTVSVRRGHKDWLVAVRQHTPGEKTLVGCKDYIELAQEDEAQRTFDRRVKEAAAAGWTASERSERAPAFTVVPPAPGVSAQTSATPRAAARR